MICIFILFIWTEINNWHFESGNGEWKLFKNR